MSTPKKLVTIVTVGDFNSKKLYVLNRYTTRKFKDAVDGTTIPDFRGLIKVDKEVYDLIISDTPPRDTYRTIRQLTYEIANCIILFFSIKSRPTFANILSDWYEEIREIRSSVPIILAGTFSDLRKTEPSENLVSYEEGVEMADKIRAYAYIECSAKENTNVDMVFEEAVRAARPEKMQKVKQKKCVIL